MSAPSTLNWIRVALVALPVYGVLTFWSTLDLQPSRSRTPRSGLASSTLSDSQIW